MKKLLPRLAAAAATLACAGTSHAVILTFDATINTASAFFAPLLTHNDAIFTQGLEIDLVSVKPDAQAGVDLVGALINGSSLAATCTSLVCPSNNPTTFLAALNDGIPAINSISGAKVSVSGFDASFIAAAGAVVPATALILRLEGYNNGALALSQDFTIPGPTAGAYSFAAYTTNTAFAATQFDFVAFRGFACDAGGSCSTQTDRGQFGLDNINIAVVPEPAEWLLMGLGLAAVGGLVRRRRAA
ncbi:MAG: NF038120 family PEP-CTERM protein [Rubrivivax sp.]